MFKHGMHVRMTRASHGALSGMMITKNEAPLQVCGCQVCTIRFGMRQTSWPSMGEENIVLVTMHSTTCS